MEFQTHKRLFKPTLLTELSIKTELEICKLIICSELMPRVKPINQDRKRLTDKLLRLQWKFMQQQTKHQKIAIISDKLSKQMLNKQQTCSQIDKINKQIILLNQGSRKLQYKLKDRNQSLIGDKKYLQKLKYDNKGIQEIMNNIKISSQSIQKKKQKINFIIKQMLRHESISFNSLQKINQQKLNIKQKVCEKINQNRKKLQITKQKIRKQNQILRSKQLENQQMQQKIKQLQQRTQLICSHLSRQTIQLKKDQQKLRQHKDIRYQLQQRLIIHRDKLQLLKERNKRLQNCKQEAKNSLQAYDLYVQRKMEDYMKFQRQIFDIEYCKKIVSL